MPGDLPMTPIRVVPDLVMVLIAVLLAAGCAGQSAYSNRENLTVIQLASENVNPGDAVEFHLLNETSLQSSCPNYIPSYGVVRLTDTGSSPWLPEPRGTIIVTNYSMNTRTQKSVYKFATNGWKPGRYRIQLDCGDISREFSVREIGTPISTPCPIQQKSTQWLNISPFYDRYVGDIFELKGTTNLPAGTNLLLFISEPSPRTCPNGRCVYTSLSGNMSVQTGDCGINNWSYSLNLSGVNPTCDLENCAPNHYVIWVGTEDRAVSDHTSFKVHGGQRPLNNYLTYDVIRGESFSYQGIAPGPSSDIIASLNGTTDTGSPSDAAISEVHVWLFGDRYANMTVISVNPDKSFNVSLNQFYPGKFSNGTYRMIIQYPKKKNLFDINVQNGTYKVIDPDGKVFLNFYDIADSKITGFKVMDLLEQELKQPGSRDQYSIITIIIGDSPYMVTVP